MRTGSSNLNARKKVCKSLKILFKIIGNLCFYVIRQSSVVKFEMSKTIFGDHLFLLARIDNFFFSIQTIFSTVLKELMSRSLSVQYRWQSLATWHSYKFEGKYGRLYEGCGGISEDNLHCNNKKMEIFSKHVLKHCQHHKNH